MGNNFIHKLKKLITKSRKIPLNNIEHMDINIFLRRLSSIHWRPDYLFWDSQHKRYIAFTIIYEAEFFPSILSQEVEKAMRNYDLDFFFILEDESLLGIFEENCREKGFGLILNMEVTLLLIRDTVKLIIPPKTLDRYAGHYPLWVINEISNINLGNSQFRTALDDFSKEYLRLKNSNRLDWYDEEMLVKKTIANILETDARYTSGVNSLEILSRFESFWYDIRDHYFHSFHIFMLGLLILDHYKDEFISYHTNVFPTYLPFSLEFLWLLTSIFHDVGYPISKLDNLKKEIYGVPNIPYEKEITNVWNDPAYRENLKQLISILGSVKLSVSEMAPN